MIDLDVLAMRNVSRDDVDRLIAELRAAREQLLHVQDLPMALHVDCEACDAIFGGVGT